MNPADVLQRIAKTLREDVGPAVDGEYPKTQAFMAAVVLQKLGRQLAVAEAHREAHAEDLRKLQADLREEIDREPVPAAVNAAMQRFSTSLDDGALTELIAALYAERVAIRDARFRSLLARVRRTLRAQIDRRLEYAR